MGSDITRPYVTSFFSHASEARDLKIGMHNPYIDGSKITSQIFDILPRSWDIGVQSFIFTSFIAPTILKLEKSLQNNIFCSNI